MNRAGAVMAGWIALVVMVNNPGFRFASSGLLAGGREGHRKMYKLKLYTRLNFENILFVSKLRFLNCPCLVLKQTGLFSEVVV